MALARSDLEIADGSLFCAPPYGEAVLCEMAASTAYEINLPLAAIALNGETVLHWVSQDQPDMDEVRRLISCIVSDAIRAAAVTTRIHSMAASQPANRTPVAVNALIQESVGRLEHEMLKHGIKIIFDLAPDLPMVSAVRIQLQQIATYLALNAIESMSQVPHQCRKLIIRTRLADKTTLSVVFEDSGIGLGCRTAEEIFRPFYTTKPDRMGLGLTVCRSIVDAHGGSIGASNNPRANGARFWFTLPGQANG